MSAQRGWPLMGLDLVWPGLLRPGMVLLGLRRLGLERLARVLLGIVLVCLGRLGLVLLLLAVHGDGLYCPHLVGIPAGDLLHALGALKASRDLLNARGSKNAGLGGGKGEPGEEGPRGTLEKVVHRFEGVQAVPRARAPASLALRALLGRVGCLNGHEECLHLVQVHQRIGGLGGIAGRWVNVVPPGPAAVLKHGYGHDPEDFGRVHPENVEGVGEQVLERERVSMVENPESRTPAVRPLLAGHGGRMVGSKKQRRCGPPGLCWVYAAVEASDRSGSGVWIQRAAGSPTPCRDRVDGIRSSVSMWPRG
ncbi:hypothetical protein GGTG_00007 [Gaeumannomyces tritici R3-111a-1]|uniref:Uncharacterized protein n=1 Tax=Gaeumannomyces tritici (strain R3-111a-1) TaxID=644352 RepID=J3NFG0_GAET3|nr:hypothetical protein GGTG_00007 [Gaeumannomyces tritici R3-111a-1]EJT80000.1 hypothetical protein GGTG_00007 [Gaeumannomyces tritici R3-111a-1]